MGLIALMVVLELVVPALAIFVTILVMARRGYPRNAGRRAYAIAVVPLALLCASIFLYFHNSQDLNASWIPVWILFIGAVAAASAAVGCLLGVLLYRKPGPG
jgi:hypothetical protein